MSRTNYTYKRHEKSFSKGLYSAAADEAGRGSLAGPLVVGVVASLQSFDTAAVDSKDSSSAGRLKIFEELVVLSRQKKIFIGVCAVSSAFIDANGIAHSLAAGASHALSATAIKPEQIWLDGPVDFFRNFPDYDPGCSVFFESKLDSKDRLCASSSIIAKVARDSMLITLGETCRGYGFEQNKGYGTRAHLDAIKKLGRSEHHRWSWSVSGVCKPAKRPDRTCLEQDIQVWSIEDFCKDYPHCLNQR